MNNLLVVSILYPLEKKTINKFDFFLNNEKVRYLELNMKALFHYLFLIIYTRVYKFTSDHRLRQ